MSKRDETFELDANVGAVAGIEGKLLYTPRAAAHALGISRSTLFVLLRKGVIPSVCIGSCRRITAEALSDYVTRLQIRDRGLQVRSTSPERTPAASQPPRSEQGCLFSTGADQDR